MGANIHLKYETTNDLLFLGKIVTFFEYLHKGKGKNDRRGQPVNIGKSIIS